MFFAIDLLLLITTAVLTTALIYSRISLQAIEKTYQRKLAARTKLVRAAAHELKQPLNAIAGLVGSLRHEKLSAQKEREDIANRLEHAVSDLSGSLVDTHEIFELSSDGLHIENEALDIRTETKVLIRKINRQLNERGSRVTVVGGQLPELWVETDKMRLNQCLRTLLLQAADQSPEGQVHLSYGVQKVQGAKHLISFIVRDNGPGMDQHRAKRFFDPSSYEQNPALRGRPAAMLALNLAAGLAELLGGGISARSSLGNGTAFEFSITAETCPPLETRSEVLHGFPQKHAETPPFEKLRVLLVDDNDVNLFVLQEFILPLGFGRVVCATSGEEAVDRANNEAFDLILMDLAMPGVDGFEAARRIRSGRMSSLTPIVAVSAEFLRSGDQRLVAAGIDGYVPKPIVNADLFAAISKVAPQIVEAARARGVHAEEGSEATLPMSA